MTIPNRHNPRYEIGSLAFTIDTVMNENVDGETSTESEQLSGEVNLDLHEMHLLTKTMDGNGEVFIRKNTGYLKNEFNELYIMPEPMLNELSEFSMENQINYLQDFKEDIVLEENEKNYILSFSAGRDQSSKIMEIMEPILSEPYEPEIQEYLTFTKLEERIIIDKSTNFIMSVDVTMDLQLQAPDEIIGNINATVSGKYFSYNAVKSIPFPTEKEIEGAMEFDEFEQFAEL